MLRQLSPAATIGGGTIIGPALRADRSPESLPGRRKRTCRFRSRTFAWQRYIELRGETIFDEASESWIGLSPSQCEAVLRAVRRAKGDRPHGRSATALHYACSDSRSSSSNWFAAARSSWSAGDPRRRCRCRSILSAMSRHASPPVLEALLDAMTAQSRARAARRSRWTAHGSGTFASPASHVGRTAGRSHRRRTNAATLKEFGEKHGYSLKDLEPLVQVAVDEGRLVRLSPQLAIDREALEALRQSLADHFQKHPTAKVGEIREQWGITRKHAVPIFEFFDQYQITSRAGDLRSAGPRMSLPIDEAIT